MTLSIPISGCGVDPEPELQREALADRILDAATHTLELYSVHLGSQLGLYELLAAESHDAASLARAGGIAPRYALEWLEQQAVAGFLEVDDSSRPAESRRYRLSPSLAPVFVDPEDPAHVAPLATMLAGVATALDEVVEAYRSGGGVPFSHYGAHLRSGQAAINRPALTHELTQEWLPAAPDLHERLGAGPCRIADVGCGLGWSTIALARAYPGADVVGVDLDVASIEGARRNAEDAGLSLRWLATDAAGLRTEGPFDLITIVESLHDMRDPSAVLAELREALAPGGSIFVVDERVSEHFCAPGDRNERLMYGWSVNHCLPASLAEESPGCSHGAEPTGTALRPGVVRELAGRAGLGSVEELPISNELFRFYRLRRSER